MNNFSAEFKAKRLRQYIKAIDALTLDENYIEHPKKREDLMAYYKEEAKRLEVGLQKLDEDKLQKIYEDFPGYKPNIALA